MRLFCRVFGHAWFWETTVADSVRVGDDLAAQAFYRCDRCVRCDAQRCSPIDSLFAVPREPSRASLLAKR